MPAPSQVTAQDINTELGISTTATIEMANNWVKNVACKSSGAISYGDCRWGINFPGGDMSTVGYLRAYDVDSTLRVSCLDTKAYDGSSTATAGAYVTFYSNGVMRLESTTSGAQQLYHKTWLTSGAAGDYTVQFQVTSGALTSGTSNTDLAMNTTRSFSVVTSTVGPNVGSDDELAYGNLIIKDSGGTLITRPIELYAQAEIII